VSSVNNIVSLREARGWKRPELARRMGTTPQQVERLEKGTRQLTVGWIDKAAEALGVPSWRIIAPEGEGTPAAPTSSPALAPQQAQKLNIIERANAGQLQAIAEYLTGTGAGQLPAGATIDELDAVLLPQVEVGFSMGGGSILEDWPVVQQVPFSRSWLRNLTRSSPADLLVASGEGDSMIPTLLDQDLVIIDQGDRFLRQPDRIWALTYGGYGMIKRVRPLPDGTIQINSDNPAVTSINAVESEVNLVGRVVGIVRRV